MKRNPHFASLERKWGIHLIAMDYLTPELREMIAMDAQPATITGANSGIPAFLLNYVDPEVVRILQAPNKGSQILGEKKVGDWTTRDVYMPVAENTGQVASYGDDSENGMSDANFNWPTRQTMRFQTVISYGDLEVDVAAEARLNLVQEKQTSAAATLDKFADYLYHFGASGLKLYGMINDPNLPAAVTPTTKTSTAGTTWGSTGAFASPNEIFNDFQILYNDLATRSAGRIEVEDPMTFVMSPNRNAALLSVNSFMAKNAKTLIKDSFPNIKFVTSPRYSVSGVEHCQLIADAFDGKKTGYCAFTVKMRDHRVVPGLSSFKQKKTAGVAGAFIRYPVAIAQMTGI